MKILKTLALLLTLTSTVAYALLEVTIIKSEENAFPIVISPFEVVGNAEQGATIANIIRDNLNRSGQFNELSSSNVITNKIDFSYWKNQGKDAIVFGKVEEISSKVFNVTIYIYDIYTKKRLYFTKIAVHNSGIRRISHFLSDKIYNILLGQKGAFDTRLTYVTVTDDKKLGKVYQLEISDSDGQNAQVVIKSLYPILSPAWSPDQKKIAYVSFQNGRSEVFIKYPFMRVKSIKIPQFDGISSAPSWHPNGQGLVLTISRKGNKDIYFYNLKSKKLDRLTKDVAIDTEANFSPDGNSIAFTSNRSGQVQIYIKDLTSKKTKRATFEGRYNAKPVFSPDGKALALIHRVGKDYRVALLDIKTRDLTVLTQNKLDESPYFSPNGGMIIFATNRNNKGVLSVISLYNNQIVELAQKGVEVREPSWSNYSN